MSHTGFSPPQTSGGGTESSGSYNVQAPASKVLKMAAEFDGQAVAAQSKQMRTSVVAAATPRNSANPFRDAFNVVSEGILDDGNQADATGHSPPRRSSPARSHRSSGSTQTFGQRSDVSESRLLHAAAVLQRKKELAQIVLEEAQLEAQLAEVRSAKGSQASSAGQGHLTASAVQAVDSLEPLRARVERVLHAAASSEGPTLPEF